MLKKYFEVYWWVLPVVFITGSILASATIIKQSQDTKTTYEFVECTGQQSADFKCWKSRYEALVMNKSPEEALASAEQESNKGGYVRTNCHQIAHVIGRQSAKKYSLNLTTTFEHGNKFCASGYYHGAMESITANVGPDKIRAEISDICKPLRDKNPYNLVHYDCAHGLGHGVMSMENYDLFKALEDCEKMADMWESESCSTGVFMENIMSIVNNPDYKTKYLRSDEPMYPCTAVNDRQKSPCYINQTSYALTAVGGSYEKVFELCSQAGNFESTCYQSLGRDASGNTIQNPDQANQICQKGVNNEQVVNCVIGAVKDIVWIGNSKPNGLVFCALQNEVSIEQTCNETVEAYYASFN